MAEALPDPEGERKEQSAKLPAQTYEFDEQDTTSDLPLLAKILENPAVTDEEAMDAFTQYIALEPYTEAAPIYFAKMAMCGKKEDVVNLVIENKVKKLNMDDRLCLLREAAAGGLVKTAKYLIDRGTPPQGKLSDGTRICPLFAAVTHNEIETAKYLLSRKARLTYTPNRTYTSIMMATVNGDSEMIKLLVANGAKPDPDKELDSPLLYAIRTGLEETAATLLKLGADPNRIDSTGRSPLEMAISTGSPKLIHDLIVHGADINNPNSRGNNAMMTAILTNRLETINILFKFNAPFEFTHEEKTNTMPEWAAINADPETCQRVLELYGDRSDHPPVLHLAILKNRNDIVKACIAAKCNVNRRYNDSNPTTPVHTAASLNRPSCLRSLIRAGARINRPCGSHDTPLITATRAGSYESAKVLLETKRTKLEITNETGETALHTAVDNIRFRIAQLLLEKGANVNAKDKTGNTPLHYAVTRGHTPIARLLIENGADLTAENNALQNPRGCAKLMNSTTMEKFLETYYKNVPEMVYATNSGDTSHLTPEEDEMARRQAKSWRIRIDTMARRHYMFNHEVNTSQRNLTASNYVQGWLEGWDLLNKQGLPEEKDNKQNKKHEPECPFQKEEPSRTTTKGRSKKHAVPRKDDA